MLRQRGFQNADADDDDDDDEEVKEVEDGIGIVIGERPGILCR